MDFTMWESPFFIFQNVYQQIDLKDSRLSIKIYNPEIVFSLSQSTK
tara:strand:- start:1081 stop:1218 length:138 start_codon:yes stop_codon:yes gene_type:complete